ncbi:hypothetical protein SVAN01_04435 [Stagonosporopsis vannaccii]|nr:hypothetical protein SVAN01_04435 [Stagonosporopsis vannaccii]
MPHRGSLQPKRDRLHPHAASGCKFSTTAGRFERQRQSPAVTLDTLARCSACDGDGGRWTRLLRLRCVRCPLVWHAWSGGERPLRAAGHGLCCRPPSAAARRTRAPWSLRARLSGSFPVRSGQALLTLLQEAFTPGPPCCRVAESQSRRTSRRQPGRRPAAVRRAAAVTAAHSGCLRWQPHNTLGCVKSAAGTSSLGAMQASAALVLSSTHVHALRCTADARCHLPHARLFDRVCLVLARVADLPVAAHLQRQKARIGIVGMSQVLNRPSSLIVRNARVGELRHRQDESTAISLARKPSIGKQAKWASSRPTAVNLATNDLPATDCKAHASHGRMNGGTRCKRTNTSLAAGLHSPLQCILAARPRVSLHGRSCLPVSSPDQGVHAVTNDHMGIMFAQHIMRVASLVPTTLRDSLETAYDVQRPRNTLPEGLQKVCRKRAIAAT